jgi:hypothetical protein
MKVRARRMHPNLLSKYFTYWLTPVIKVRAYEIPSHFPSN